MPILAVRRSHIFQLLAALGLLAGLAAVVNGCETGGKEGDRCNALVEQDECIAGLHCQQVTCDRTYCCPTDRSSTEPNCNGNRCPSGDAGDEGGDSAVERPDAGPDSGAVDASSEDAADTSDARDL